jgi:stage V sporulation protein SpoVS
MAKVSKYGQWQYPGEDTLIPNVNGSITMQGVPYPVLGIDDLGNQQMMMPGTDYQFPGDSVYEIPMPTNNIMARGFDRGSGRSTGVSWPMQLTNEQRALDDWQRLTSNGRPTFEKRIPAPNDKTYQQLLSRQEGGNAVISDPNIIAQLIDNYKANINSYKNGGRVLNRYQGDEGQNTVVEDPEEQSRLKKVWEKFDISSPEGLKKKEAWSNYNASTSQWWDALKKEQERMGRDLTEREKEKWIQDQARGSSKAMKGFRYNRDKDQRFDFLFNPEQQYDPGSGTMGFKMNPVVIEPNWTPEELKLNEAKKEFLAQINSDPLQKSMGQEASLRNPNTRAAAETYARYKVYGEQPGGRLDRWFRGNQEPSLRDFYEPNTASNTVKGAGALAATAAGTAGLAALGTGAVMMAPEAYAAAQPFIQATGAALEASPTWAPGLSIGNTLAAYDAAYVGKEVLDSESDVRKSIDVAADNPNTENILNAVGQVGLTGLDALGIGLFRGGKELVKDAYRGITAPFKMPSPSVLTPELQMAGFSPTQIYNKFKETNFYKALSPGARKQLQLDIDNGKVTHKDLWDKMNDAQTETNTLEWNINNKLRDSNFMSYMAQRRMVMNKEGLAKGNLNNVRPRKERTIQKAGAYTSEDGKLVTRETAPFFNPKGLDEPIVNTGKGEITDLRTGKRVGVEVTPSQTTKSFSLDDVNESPNIGESSLKPTTESAGLPTTSDSYKATLKSNIDYIEETIPGSKVFGSSRGALEGNLPHLSGDYDVLISQTNYNKHVKDKYRDLGDNGPARLHDISNGKGDDSYHIDFNIIAENPDGTVKPTWKAGRDGIMTSTEVQLFRQNFPEDFFKAAQEAAKSGDYTNIKINKTADELINGSDPAVKTIMDAYESGKPKHVNRIDAYINYGDVDKVTKAQDSYIKSLVGTGGNLGKQFPEGTFSDVNKNKELLEKIGFVGDRSIVANDPKRMQLAINDYYINNTTFTRNVNLSSLKGGKPGDVLESSLEEWYPFNIDTRTVRGTGQNNVRLGTAGHMESPGDTITAFKQLGLDLETDDPFDYVDRIFRQTDGNYILNQDELKKVNDLLDKHFGPGTALQVEATGAPLSKSTDIITLHDRANSPTYKYNLPKGPASLNAQNEADYTKHKEFLADIEKELGIRTITNENYYNSDYASTLGKFNKQLDVMGYGFLGTMPKVKSLTQRQSNYQGYEKTVKQVGDIMNSNEFKQVEGLVKGGLPKAKARLAQLEQEAFEIEQETRKLQAMYTSKESAQLQALKDHATQLSQDWTDAAKKLNELQRTQWKIDALRSNMLHISAATGVAGALVGTGYLFKDELFNTPGPPERSTYPGASGNRPTRPVPASQESPSIVDYLVSPEKAIMNEYNKKYGGEVKFGSKPFIGYLPFTHYQLK